MSEQSKVKDYQKFQYDIINKGDLMNTLDLRSTQQLKRTFFQAYMEQLLKNTKPQSLPQLI